MTGGERSFFGNTTAAMIGAIAALITAVLGVVVFLVGYFDSDGPEGSRASNQAQQGQQAPVDEGGAGATGASPRKLDGAVQFRDNLLLAELSSVDWDQVPPLRDGDGVGSDDTYIFPQAEISSPWHMVRWRESRTPGINDCAYLIATHGVSADQIIEIGARFCIRTSEGRTVFLSVLNRADGWEVEATVWRERS